MTVLAAPVQTVARLGRRVGRAGAMSTLVALGTLLVIELLRAFPALVATTVDQAGQVPFGLPVIVLVAPFGATVAVALMVAGTEVDPRRVLLCAGALLAVGRVGAQLVHGDLGAVVAGLGLVGGLVALVLLAQIGLPLLGGGVVAGAGLSAALRIALGSRDLIWIDHVAALSAVVVTCAWFLALLVQRTRRPVDLLGRSWPAAVPLLALGPVLLLEAFVLTNLGWVAPGLDRGWVAASFVIGIAAAGGVAGAAWTAAGPGGRSRWLGVVGAAAVIGLAAAQAAPSDAWVPVLVLAQAGIGGLLTAASARGLRTGGRWPAGAVLAAAPVFLHVSIVALDGRGLLGITIRPSAAVAVSGAVLLVAAIGGLALPAPAAHHPGWRHVPSLGAVFVLPAMLLLAGLPLLARAAGGGAEVGDSRDLRVATFNVALGFAPDGSLNLDEVAAVLAAARADVVALQEVPRGFLPTGGIDMIGYLQNQLGMAYVAFQPSSPGALHGNAVLSRHPIRSVTSRYFARTGTALPRGAVSATIDVPGGPSVHVISAHLPPSGTPAERAARVDAILGLWGERARTVVGIDANAGPSSSMLTRLADGGLVVVDSDAPTFPSDRPRAQIDFVLLSPDLEAVEVETPPGDASDHLPVLVVIRPADLV